MKRAVLMDINTFLVTCSQVTQTKVKYTEGTFKLVSRKKWQRHDKENKIQTVTFVL